MPPAAPELTPLAAALYFSSLAVSFAAVTIALRLAAKYLLGFSPSWRRCFALSCAGLFAATAVVGLSAGLLGRWTPPGGIVELLLGLLAAAVIYVRFLRPPADASSPPPDAPSLPTKAPPPWRFFAVAVAQFVVWMIVSAVFGAAATVLLPPVKV